MFYHATLRLNVRRHAARYPVVARKTPRAGGSLKHCNAFAQLTYARACLANKEAALSDSGCTNKRLAQSYVSAPTYVNIHRMAQN